MLNTGGHPPSEKVTFVNLNLQLDRFDIQRAFLWGLGCKILIFVRKLEEFAEHIHEKTVAVRIRCKAALLNLHE